jgi:hypothetical protein
MKKLFFVIIILYQSQLCFTQGFENSILFGYSGGYKSLIGDKYGINILTFNEGSLKITDDQFNSTFFNDTDAAISDSNGLLQFYYNGIDIFDKTYTIMQNGGLINEFSSTGFDLPQGGIIIPWPDRSNKYILFSLDEEWIEYPDGWTLGGGTACSYSVVDMTLNNGLGKVIERKIPIVTDTVEYGKLAVVRHANGRDWWLIVPELRTNRFYTLLIDPQGVHFEGIQSAGIKREYPGIGQATFSPDGAKYVMQNATGVWVGYYVDIYDFDRCSGLFSNHEQMHFVDTIVYSATISPNSKWLYLIGQNQIFQYNLLEDTVALSGELIAEYEPFNDPFPTPFLWSFLAPDNKIYIVTTSGSRTLHVIHSPDEEGINCAFEQHGIRLPCNNAQSLPTFANYRLGPMDGSICDSLGIDNNPVSWWRYTQDTTQTELFEFTDLAYHEPTSWLWDFGDGNTSQDRSPFHTFTQSGVYNVCLIVCNAYSCDTLCREVTVGVIGVKETDVSSNTDLQIYPNPATNILYFKVTTTNEFNYQLTDLTGRVVLQGNKPQSSISHQYDLNIVTLPVGMYVLSVRDRRGLIGVKKVVIQR